MPGWDETENEYRYRLKDPSLFKEDSFRTKDIENGVYLIIGKLKKDDSKTTAQSLRFKKDVFKNMADAKNWKKDHWDKQDQDSMISKKTRIKNGKLQYLEQHSIKMELNKTDIDNVLKINNETLNHLKDENGVLRLPRSTMLIGDGIYNNIYHPSDEIAKSHMTMDHQPLVINHDETILSEIGWMEQPQYDPDSKKYSAIPVINLKTLYGPSSFMHIQNRFMAGKAPETSVSFWCSENTETINDKEMLVARDMEFDNNSLVFRGACGPGMGAGIGLNLDKVNNEDNFLGGHQNMDDKDVDEIIKNNKKNEELKNDYVSREDFHKNLHDELQRALMEREKERQKNEQQEKFLKAYRDKNFEEMEKYNPFTENIDLNDTDKIKALQKDIDELKRMKIQRVNNELYNSDNITVNVKNEKTMKEEHAKRSIRTGRAILEYIMKVDDKINLSVKKDDYDEIPPEMLMNRGVK